jgi:hypothetical protein
MRIRCLVPVLMAAALPVVACKTVAGEGREQPPAVASATPKKKAMPSVEDAGVAAAPARDEPLAWGTRPPANGPLYPIVDGMCVHGEVWPTKTGALFTYGNGTGAWSRGDEATMARFVDDGVEPIVEPSKGQSAEAWGSIAPLRVEGTWPAPLLVYSNDNGGGRMRSWTTIWSRGPDGFTILASHREGGSPIYGEPVVFRGHAVTARYEPTSTDDVTPAVYKAFPLEKGAPSITNLGSIGRAGFILTRLAANDTSLFALGREFTGPSSKSVLRVLSDGRVKELAIPGDQASIVATRPSLVLMVDGRNVFRLDDAKLVPVDTKLPASATIAAAAVAPNGDIWLLPKERASVLVARRDGRVDTLSLPAPASPRPKEAVLHWPTSGSALAGVDVDDPYAIGTGGSLFHFEQGRWVEIELPEPPFAVTGKYQAQAVVVPAKGDVYVNAGYAEKGIGWKTVERYRAVLRNHRPKEVVRCNEPRNGSNAGSGRGFMSFPPMAQESCATPFVILLRLAYDVGRKEPVYVYDPKSDYPSVREAIKATPSVGASVDLVEIVSGTQRYLGARVPNIAAGRELAQAVAKRVTGFAEVRPEIVCGLPKVERSLQVDVASGKVATAIKAAQQGVSGGHGSGSP